MHLHKNLRYNYDSRYNTIQNDCDRPISTHKVYAGCITRLYLNKFIILIPRKCELIFRRLLVKYLLLKGK